VTSGRLAIRGVLDEARGGSLVLEVAGALTAATYHQLRDAIIKAALATPRAVIVDVDSMTITTPSALAAFTSARWHVSPWPDVPIVVAAGDETLRSAFAGVGVTRYVPVYPTVEAATAAARNRGYRYRRRAVAGVDHRTPLRYADHFVEERLRAWSLSDRQLALRTIAKALVENAATHGGGGRAIRLEFDGELATVAVSDDNPVPAVRRERGPADHSSRGLDIVAALSRSWRNSPTGTGKTVWAVVGPENGLRGLAENVIDEPGR
jgi:hypothetical protein